jgi:N-acetylglucosaminyl-diphospho-decaprenol L-rhamnosyltransferase
MNARITPRVAAVVVNWNAGELLRRSLGSLTAALQPDDEIWLVDNDSTDGSVDHMSTDFPRVQVIRNNANPGFGAASNQGARASTAQYLLMFGPDASCEPATISALRSHLELHPDVAVAGPRLVYPDGAFQRWTAGQPVTLANAAKYCFFVDHLAKRIARCEGMFASVDRNEVRDVGWVTGAVMMLRREAFEQVAMFDERIFLYMEDVDLCHRLREHGYRVSYLGSVTATHAIGSTTTRSSKASPAAITSMLRWYERTHGPVASAAFRAVIAAGFALRFSLLRVAGSIIPTARRRAADHRSNLRVAMDTHR